MDYDYPNLRAALAPQYAALPGSELTQLVRAVYGEGADAEDVEGLFDNIGRGLKAGAKAVGHFAQQAAPVVAKALPAMAQGAAGGAAFGPWGALIGAGMGATSGILSQSRNSTARGIGGALHTAGSLVSTVRGGGATGALGSLASIGSGAFGASHQGRQMAATLAGNSRGPTSQGGSANALMGLLARPELLQALTSGLLGSYGRRSIPVAGQQIPVHQMLSALGNVAQRAANEAAEYDESADQVPAYAEGAEAILGIEANDAEGRVDTLLTLLALSPSIWMSRTPPPVVVNTGKPDSGYAVDNFWENQAVGWEASDEQGDEQGDESWPDDEGWDEQSDEDLIENWGRGDERMEAYHV